MSSEENAVVVGAGIAGLCVARVLADFYATVTILDQDELPERAEQRGGVPQDRHVHAVLVRGAMALRELFPGLISELAAQGIPIGDVLADSVASMGPHRLIRATSGLQGVCVSRPRLEHVVRQRLDAFPNVSIISNSTVTGLVVSEQTDVVTGVRTRTGGDEQTLTASLVVDASGRRSQTSQWLTDLGHSPPPEQRFPIDVAYSSCSFSLAPGTITAPLGLLVAPTPQNPRGAAVIDMGGGRWLVSLSGYHGYHPPLTPDGFLEFARQLAIPDVHDALRDAQPLGTPVRFRVPAVVRRAYRRLTRFPEGLIILGDAACNFNPIYGQGMSVAAQQAINVRQHLRQAGTANFPRLRASVERTSSAAWQMSVNSDLRMPWIPGRRTVAGRLSAAYQDLVIRAAADDEHVARAFIRVANLIDPPSALVRPAITFRVMIGALRQARTSAAVPAGTQLRPDPLSRRPDCQQ